MAEIHEQLQQLRNKIDESLPVLTRAGLTPTDAWRVATGRTGPMVAPLDMRPSELHAILDLADCVERWAQESNGSRPWVHPELPNHHLAFMMNLRSIGGEPSWHSGKRTAMGEYMDECHEAWARGEEPPESAGGELVDERGAPVNDKLAEAIRSAKPD